MDICQAINVKLSRRHFKSDERIVEETAEDESVFFVLSGSVRIGQYTPNGHELIYSICGQGDMFGEFAAINHSVRSANVYALEETELASMSAEDFRSVLHDYPDISLRLNQRLSHMIMAMNDRIKQRSENHAQTRLYAYIALEAERHAQAAEPLFIAIPKQAILAALLDISRETVARALGHLAEVGIIHKVRGGVELLSKKKLVALLHLETEKRAH